MEGLSTYIEIFSPKKTGFSPVKNTSLNFLWLVFTFILCNFSVQTLQYFQKTSNLFFAREKKKGPQKLLITAPNFFFHKYGPAAQTNPEFIFHIINVSQDSSVSFSVFVIFNFSIWWKLFNDFWFYANNGHFRLALYITCKLA